jgi:hypothetical protein
MGLNTPTPPAAPSIARVEPLGEPAAHWSQQFAGLLHLALVAPEAGIDSLIRGLGMPRSLGAVKIGRDNFQRIAV